MTNKQCAFLSTFRDSRKVLYFKERAKCLHFVRVYLSAVERKLNTILTTKSYFEVISGQFKYFRKQSSHE